MITQWLNTQQLKSETPTLTVYEITEKNKPSQKLIRFLQECILKAYLGEDLMKCTLNRYSKKQIRDYINEQVIPGDDNQIVKNVRQGDIGEIIVSWIIKFVQHQEPFNKLKYKFNKDRSVFGVDVLAFDSLDNPSTLTYYEVKTRNNALKKEKTNKKEPTKYISVIAYESLASDASEENQGVLKFMAQILDDQGEYDKAAKFIDCVMNPQSIKKKYHIYLIADDQIIRKKNYPNLLSSLKAVQDKLSPLSYTVIFVSNLEDFILKTWSSIAVTGASLIKL